MGEGESNEHRATFFFLNCPFTGTESKADNICRHRLVLFSPTAPYQQTELSKSKRFSSFHPFVSSLVFCQLCFQRLARNPMKIDSLLNCIEKKKQNE